MDRYSIDRIVRPTDRQFNVCSIVKGDFVLVSGDELTNGTSIRSSRLPVHKPLQIDIEAHCVHSMGTNRKSLLLCASFGP